MTGRRGQQLPVAIVGAGFSGTLLAVNLMRQGVDVVLVERDKDQIAKGLAFGTRRPEHLLNVRAANMSAFPDDPGHFLRWMGFSDKEQANRFVPRHAYGLYLRELLLTALSAAPERAKIVQGEARAASFEADRISLAIGRGPPLACRSLVLAPGNPPPGPVGALGELPEGLIFSNPWVPAAVEGVEQLEHIVLVGSGLTAADVALSLVRAGFRGRITALSRRGLKPRAHADVGPAVSPVSQPEQRGSWLLRTVRRRADAIGWRAAVDELRPHTQQLWRSHDIVAQRRLLRHLRPYWDVHRHRLAPMVSQQIEDLERTGRLEFRAGKLLAARPAQGRACLDWRPRGSDLVVSIVADRVINCTGPEAALTRAENPILVDLLQQGRLRPDPHRLGLDVHRSGKVYDTSGQPQDRLFAVGPVTKGEAWEMVAVPDIRRQVWDLARLLGNAHWVGGEGL